MTKIMIIRHAEKPSEDGLDAGVTSLGGVDRHELCVRGWQRAGALARFFAPRDGAPPAPLATPASIFASAAMPGSPSLRAQRTVAPLAELLGLPVQCRHAEGEEMALAQVIARAPGPALVCWHHRSMVPLVHAIAGHHVALPRRWPDARFDLVWVLDRDGEGWRFRQVPQLLLAGDLVNPA